jgi:ribonucleotide monophosphatase NagD (HAD superfamily)
MARPLLCGKPAPAFFREALHSLGLPPAEVAMIGDGAESEFAGAMALGCRGILAQTGKYCSEEETRIVPAPDAMVADVTEAVACLLGATRPLRPKARPHQWQRLFLDPNGTHGHKPMGRV